MQSGSNLLGAGCKLSAPHAFRRAILAIFGAGKSNRTYADRRNDREKRKRTGRIVPEGTYMTGGIR